MKTLKTTILILMTLVLSFLTGCKDKNQGNQNETEVTAVSYSEEELYRPNFHFTP